MALLNLKPAEPRASQMPQLRRDARDRIPRGVSDLIERPPVPIAHELEDAPDLSRQPDVVEAPDVLGPVETQGPGRQGPVSCWQHVRAGTPTPAWAPGDP